MVALELECVWLGLRWRTLESLPGTLGSSSGWSGGVRRGSGSGGTARSWGSVGLDDMDNPLDGNEGRGWLRGKGKTWFGLVRGRRRRLEMDLEG